MIVESIVPPSMSGVLISGLVKVLLVNVSAAVINETVPVKFGIVIVLSAPVGLVISNVVSKSSALEPSNTILSTADIVAESTVVCVPWIVKLPETITS